MPESDCKGFDLRDSGLQAESKCTRDDHVRIHNSSLEKRQNAQTFFEGDYKDFDVMPPNHEITCMPLQAIFIVAVFSPVI